MVKQTDYNSISWGDYFYVDETSPSGLRRKVDILAGQYYGILAGVKDSVAGTKRYESNGKPSRWRVRLLNKTYAVHRIIYTIINGYTDPLKVVDHLDGNPFNNDPKNLSLKIFRANTQNQTLRVTNKSGITGVTLTTNGILQYWSACWIAMDGKFQRKNFSIKKLGYETAKQLAIEHRNLQISLLNAAGASYTSRHCGLTPAEPPAISPVQPT